MFDNTVERTRRLSASLFHRWLLLRHRESSTLSSAVAEARRINASLVGVDVFDTVLIRRLMNDEAFEHAVGHRVVAEKLWPGSIEAFLAARDDAQAVRPGESLLSWLQSIPGLPDPLRTHATALEAELFSTVAVPGAHNALAELRTFTKVMFVSDMHFTESALRDLLEDKGLSSDEDEVISSCDWSTSKAEGGLYTQILGATDPATRGPDMVFIGNDSWADVTQATRAGLVAIPASTANPTRYEEAIATVPGSRGAAIAGAARLQRLELRSEDDQIRVVSAQVIGQSMAAFLFWVREECRKSGVRRIEFLARDGELPLRMAEAMDPQIWAGHDLRYLHCGRKAWSLAAAPLVGIDEWIAVGTRDSSSFLMHSATTVPFRRLLERCGLEVSDLPADSELATIDAERALDLSGARAWESLLRSGCLNEPIIAVAWTDTELVIDFLRQSDMPQERMAFVDVGWRGQQAWLISALVREATGYDPIHLHFGGDAVLPFHTLDVEIRRFAFDDSINPHQISSPVACLEMFLASGEPRLVGYRRDASGSVVEIFEDSPSLVKNRSHRLIVEGAVDLARRLPSEADMEWWGLTEEPLTEQVRELLAMFWNDPTALEAGALTGLRFESDDSGAVVGNVIRPYQPSEIVGRDLVPRVWRQGSLRLTSQWFRPLMLAYFAIRQRGIRSACLERRRRQRNRHLRSAQHR